MTYLLSLTNKECSLNFNDEDGIEYKGSIKDVALMFARHVYNNYNGYVSYIINKTIKVVYTVENTNNKFSLIWLKTYANGLEYPPPEWWGEFKKEFDKIMKMKAFM